MIAREGRVGIIPAMDDLRFGRLVRVLRRRRRWRQADLARRARVGRTVMSTIELGRARSLRLGTLGAVAGELGASLEITTRGLGADVERVLDERHARLVGATASWLASLGWQVQAEVSYSEWGERGSIDVLAWQVAARALLVVDVKTELASVEATLRKHDKKVRLAPGVAARRWAWRPTAVARLVVLPADRTQRRRVAAHAAVLEPAYPARTHAMRAWCRRPSGTLSGLMFVPDVASGGTRPRVGRGERVRLPRG